jgi:hypothetical protein
MVEAVFREGLLEKRVLGFGKRMDWNDYQSERTALRILFRCIRWTNYKV